MKAIYHEPNDDEYVLLAKQWLAVKKIVAEDYGVELDQSEDSIALLQRILDDQTFGEDEYALQCLGLALGRIMATNIEGLDWWIVEDDWGRDPCLRWNRSTFQVNPITMISKRVIDDGKEVDLKHLYDEIRKIVAEETSAGDYPDID